MEILDGKVMVKLKVKVKVKVKVKEATQKNSKRNLWGEPDTKTCLSTPSLKLLARLPLN